MSDRDAVPARPSVRDDVVFRALGQEWVAYDPARRQLHVFNATAALVWSLCDGERDEADIAGVVEETLQSAPELPAVLNDVREVLRTFAREGLLK